MTYHHQLMNAILYVGVVVVVVVIGIIFRCVLSTVRGRKTALTSSRWRACPRVVEPRFVRKHTHTLSLTHTHTRTHRYDKVNIAEAVNVKTISLDEAPQGYAEFDAGASVKYVIDPHGMVDAPKFNKV